MLSIEDVNRLQELVQDKIENTKNENERLAMVELDNTLADLLGSLQ